MLGRSIIQMIPAFFKVRPGHIGLCLTDPCAAFLKHSGCIGMIRNLLQKVHCLLIILHAELRLYGIRIRVDQSPCALRDQLIRLIDSFPALF